jgi:GGDEF domain-containing protein
VSHAPSGRDDGRQGRAVLAEVANQLAALLRVTDVVAYTQGAPRLTLLLSDTSSEEAEALVERLTSHPEIAGRVRIGVASFPDEALTYRALKELAAERERALDRAPAAGSRRRSRRPSVA